MCGVIFPNKCLVCPSSYNVTNETTASVETHNPFLNPSCDHRCCEHAWSQYSAEALSVVVHLITLFVVILTWRVVSKGRKLEHKFRTEGVKREGKVIGHKVNYSLPERGALGYATETHFALLVEFQNYRGEMVVKEGPSFMEKVTILKGSLGQKKWVERKACAEITSRTIVKTVKMTSRFDSYEQAYDHRGDLVCEYITHFGDGGSWLFEGQDGKLCISAAIGRTISLNHLPEYPNSACFSDFVANKSGSSFYSNVIRGHPFILLLVAVHVVLFYCAYFVLESFGWYSDIQFGLRRMGMILACAFPVILYLAWSGSSRIHSVTENRKLNGIYREGEMQSIEGDAMDQPYTLEGFDLPVLSHSFVRNDSGV